MCEFGLYVSNKKGIISTDITLNRSETIRFDDFYTFTHQIISIFQETAIFPWNGRKGLLLTGSNKGLVPNVAIRIILRYMKNFLGAVLSLFTAPFTLS